MMIVAALLLALADGGARQAHHRRDRTGRRLAMGFGQAIALQPGVSRSGVTISVGRFLGLGRDGAARFAFLMSLPITTGAAVQVVRMYGARAAFRGLPGPVHPRDHRLGHHRLHRRVGHPEAHPHTVPLRSWSAGSCPAASASVLLLIRVGTLAGRRVDGPLSPARARRPPCVTAYATRAAIAFGHGHRDGVVAYVDDGRLLGHRERRRPAVCRCPVATRRARRPDLRWPGRRGHGTAGTATARRLGPMSAAAPINPGGARRGARRPRRPGSDAAPPPRRAARTGRRGVIARAGRPPGPSPGPTGRPGTGRGWQPAPVGSTLVALAGRLRGIVGQQQAPGDAARPARRQTADRGWMRVRRSRTPRISGWQRPRHTPVTTKGAVWTGTTLVDRRLA